MIPKLSKYSIVLFCKQITISYFFNPAWFINYYCCYYFLFKYKLTNEEKDFDFCRSLYFKSSKIIRPIKSCYTAGSNIWNWHWQVIFQFGLLQISMNAMRMLKTTAVIRVSIVEEVTTVIVQMDSKCHKTTRPVNVHKVSRSRLTGQCAWVSSI